MDFRGGRQGCECLAEPGLSGEVCLAFEPQPCPARQRAHGERTGALGGTGDQVMPVGRSEVLHYLSFFNSSLGPLQYSATAAAGQANIVSVFRVCSPCEEDMKN